MLTTTLIADAEAIARERRPRVIIGALGALNRELDALPDRAALAARGIIREAQAAALDIYSQTAASPAACYTRILRSMNRVAGILRRI